MKRADVKLDMAVKYSTVFLRNTGQYRNVPVNGKVVGFHQTITNWVMVQWSGREEAVMVSCHNLTPADTVEMPR